MIDEVARMLRKLLPAQHKNRKQNFNIHLATQQQNHPPKSPSWDLTFTRLSTIYTVCLVQPCPACSWSIGSCHSPSLLFACDDVKESPSGLRYSGLGTTKNSQDWAAWLIQYLTNQKKHIQSKSTPRQLEAKGPRGREQRLGGIRSVGTTRKRREEEQGDEDDEKMMLYHGHEYTAIDDKAFWPELYRAEQSSCGLGIPLFWQRLSFQFRSALPKEASSLPQRCNESSECINNSWTNLSKT